MKRFVLPVRVMKIVFIGMIDILLDVKRMIKELRDKIDKTLKFLLAIILLPFWVIALMMMYAPF